jgi:hypothetical protein
MVKTKLVKQKLDAGISVEKANFWNFTKDSS